MSIQFSRNLIKGKIAEVIFEQMIREEGRYEIIPFGYEHTVPALAQYRHLVQVQKVIDNISDAPDFALISNDKSQVYMVEVKYRIGHSAEDIKDVAASILERWYPSWLFIATPQGFYCAPCSSIAETGKISPLSTNWVTAERQAEYLNLLNEFERK